jgi:hypothetical protein
MKRPTYEFGALINDAEHAKELHETDGGIPVQYVDVGAEIRELQPNRSHARDREPIYKAAMARMHAVLSLFR